jgi:hypothetical protein
MQKLFKKFTFKFTKSNTNFYDLKLNLAQLITKILIQLGSECLKDLSLGRNYLIICKLENRSNKYETIIPLNCINFNYMFKLKILIIRKLLNIDLNQYKSIQFLYLPMPLHKNVIYSDDLETKYPKTMDLLEDWGIKVKQVFTINHVDSTYYLDNSYYHIRQKSDKYWFINLVAVYKQCSEGNIFESTFIDYRQPMDNINTFIRKIDNTLFHFIDGELVSRIEITDQTN